MKKQMKKELNIRKRRNPNKIVKIILIIIILLSIIFFSLLIFESSIPESLKSFFDKPKMYSIVDECSLIFNKVVHQIKSEGDCNIMCRNECILEKMNFYEVNFTLNSNSCNICDCYCK